MAAGVPVPALSSIRGSRLGAAHVIQELGQCGDRLIGKVGPYLHQRCGLLVRGWADDQELVSPVGLVPRGRTPPNTSSSQRRRPL